MLLKNLFISSLIISSVFLSINSLPVSAKNELKINQKNQSEIQKLLKNIQEKDPQKVISQKLKQLKLNKSDQNELISEQSDNFQIKFNLKDKKIQIKNKQKGDVWVGIPNSEQMD
jgi:hypothetical protein